LGAQSRVRPNRIPLWVGCVAATLSTSAAVHASGASYRLQVARADGAGSCPSESDIERDVSRRLGRHPFSDAGERGIDVVLERSDGRWLAKLYLRVDASDTDAARLIESDAVDCSELGKSVALAVALAIAPELSAEPEPEPEPEPVCPPPPPPRVIVTPPKASLHGAASARLLFSPNALPHRSFGSALSVSLRGDLVGANFGGFFYPQSEVQQAGAHLGFGLSAAFASGCLWARTSEPQVWSCIGARAGLLHAVVYTPEPNRPGDHFWWAASSELGLRQRLFGRVFFELGAAVVFPLLRQRFEVEAAPTAVGMPSATRLVYEQGPALVEGFLGLGLHLD
jgi:hypothetical protein